MRRHVALLLVILSLMLACGTTSRYEWGVTANRRAPPKGSSYRMAQQPQPEPPPDLFSESRADILRIQQRIVAGVNTELGRLGFVEVLTDQPDFLVSVQVNIVPFPPSSSAGQYDYFACPIYVTFWDARQDSKETGDADKILWSGVMTMWVTSWDLHWGDQNIWVPDFIDQFFQDYPANRHMQFLRWTYYTHQE